MSRQTKRELLEENDELRSKLEEIHSQIGDALGYDEDEDGSEELDEEFELEEDDDED
jgi:hypothetical protein